jgi:tetratricopeptide (TPR) repeat protein
MNQELAAAALAFFLLGLSGCAGMTTPADAGPRAAGFAVTPSRTDSTLLDAAASVPRSNDRDSHLAIYAGSAARAGCLEGVANAVKTIDVPYHKAMAMASLGVATWASGRAAEAAGLLDEALRFSQKIPAGGARAGVLIQLAEAHAKTGAKDEAAEACRQAVGAGGKSALGVLDGTVKTVARCARAGVGGAAAELARGIEETAYRAGAMAEVGRVLAEAGEKGPAGALLSEAVALLPNEDPPCEMADYATAPCGSRVRHQIALGYAATGQWNKALSIAAGLKRGIARAAVLQEMSAYWLKARPAFDADTLALLQKISAPAPKDGIEGSR